jgi:flagellar biosynthetic protein FlhB
VSDEAAEKHFEATPLRRERARREGNAARSHELAGIAAFAGGLVALTLALPPLASAAAGAVRTFDPLHSILLLGLAFVPACGAALGALAASLAQSGGLRFAAPAFAIGKLAPWPGLKRMFGIEAVVGAVRALSAFGVVIAAIVPIGLRAVAGASAGASPANAAHVALDGMLETCFVAAGSGGLFALADYALARRRWLRSLRMTIDEFKRDAKEQDGDPHAKSRRKQLHRTLSRGAVSRTREAAFVVVNPTHLAIAVRYAPPEVPVPEIVVRAAGAVALEVRAIAERARIPVLEDVVLARLLWRSGEAGRPIPPQTFVAVAYAIAGLVRAGLIAA